MLKAKPVLLTVSGLTTVIGGSGAAYLLLSQDKTIKDKLNREKIEFAQISEEYQVAFKELRKTNGFIEDIKVEDSEITADSEFSKGGKALETWCKKNKELPLNTKDIDTWTEKVNNYCKRRALTMGQKIFMSNKAMVEDWKAKLTSIKDNDSELLTDLQKINRKVTSFESPDENIVNGAFQGWCEGNLTHSIIDDKDDTIWNKMEKRCLA